MLLCFLQLCVSDTGSLEVISEGKIGPANLTTEGVQTKSADMELKQAEKPGNYSLDASGLFHHSYKHGFMMFWILVVSQGSKLTLNRSKAGVKIGFDEYIKELVYC